MTATSTTGTVAHPAAPFAGRAVVARLADGRRLHLNDGPIDLIVEADGPADAVEAALAAAAGRFVGVLDQLCGEIDALRRPAVVGDTALVGPVARRMGAAVAPFAGDVFITPMAAVAGAVADEILAHMRAAAGPDLRRAYVNNGGDIALLLAPGATFAIGVVDRPDRPDLVARVRVAAGTGIGGIATSGVHGRSFSLGIADAVTILARSAAEADAAATVVANAVDLPHHPGVVRVPARDLAPDSDLGDRPVTRIVPPLAAEAIAAALDAGAVVANDLLARGLIAAALIRLQGRGRTVGAAADGTSTVSVSPTKGLNP